MQSTQIFQWKLCKLLTKAHLISSLECSLREKKRGEGMPTSDQACFPGYIRRPETFCHLPKCSFSNKPFSSLEEVVNREKNNSLYMHATFWLRKCIYAHGRPDRPAIWSTNAHNIIDVKILSFEPHNILLSCYPILQRRKLTQISYSQSFKNISECLLWTRHDAKNGGYSVNQIDLVPLFLERRLPRFDPETHS